MSEDAEALEQLEQLLTMVVKRQPRGGRRLTVYAMKNADATRLAGELNQFYRSISRYGRTSIGRVAFAADERLNAIVVFAARADQLGAHRQALLTLEERQRQGRRAEEGPQGAENRVAGRFEAGRGFARRRRGEDASKFSKISSSPSFRTSRHSSARL